MKNAKQKIIVVLLLYVVVVLVLVLPLSVSWNQVSNEASNIIQRMPKFTESFKANLTKPIDNIKYMFNSKETLNIVGVLSLITFGLFAAATIKLSIEEANKSDYSGKENGSSDWSKKGEEFKELNGKEILNRKNGFILTRTHFLGTDLKKVAINKNILVFGGSGTGKSACYVKPNILQKLGSYVITDPKGELYRETSEYLRASGYDVKVFNLVNQDYSDRYNPLAHIIDYKDVDVIAHTIVTGGSGDDKNSGDPFWTDTAKMLLKSCIYYILGSSIPEEEKNLSSCANIIRAGGADDSVFDKLFIDELDPEHAARKEYESLKVAADKTKQSIAISTVSKLAHFDSPNIKKITTTNNIDFEDLGRRKTAIYVVSPDDHSAYNYILTIFYGQLMTKLYSAADKNGGMLKEQVYLLLDEFANIGQIPDFTQKLSTTRSRGISVSIIVQSIDQLENLYKEFETIIANCDTQLFLGSQSIKTCEYMVKSLGQKTIKIESKSFSKDKGGDGNKGVSISEQRQGRELMTVDELKRLPMEDLILIVRGLKPIRAQKYWWFKYHPEKDNVVKYSIKDYVDAPKFEHVEPKTFNVEEHFNTNKRLAKEIEQARDNKLQENNKNNTISDAIQNKPEPEELDIQSALEKKFDELFGKSDNFED
ncbi:MAG: type IV secretory system conjugative DNA transfer family protein [Clostridia bacterium]